MFGLFAQLSGIEAILVRDLDRLQCRSGCADGDLSSGWCGTCAVVDKTAAAGSWDQSDGCVLVEDVQPANVVAWRAGDCDR